MCLTAQQWKLFCLTRGRPRHLFPRVQPDVNRIWSQPGRNRHFLAANTRYNANAVIKDHAVAEQTRERYFFTVLVLARFSLSIKRRSEAEHLERTIPISDSFLRSIAASAAPSRSLVKYKKEKLPKEGGATSLTHPYHVYLIARWARTFCSGITLETYFLASYLLLRFMQTSTKG